MASIPVLSALSSLTGALREALFSVSQTSRLLTLTGLQPGASVVVERVVGSEGINQLFRFELEVLSPQAYFALEDLIGRELSLGLLQADGTRRSWQGIVTEASRLDADGGLARYKLVMESWVAWLQRREDCYLFQDQNALGIVETLLSDWPQASFEIRVSDDTRARLPVYRTRTQWQESDADFLLRVLADDGLSYFFEHEPPGNADNESSDGDEAASQGQAGGPATWRHTLVIVDASYAWPDAEQPSIRYHRSDGTEFEDSIHALTGQRRSGTAQVQRSAWDAPAVVAPPAQGDVDGLASSLPALEDFDGSVAIPATSTPQGDAISWRADVAAMAHAQHLTTWRGLSSVRSLAPASRFTLSGHPDFDAFGGARGFGTLNPSARFLVETVHHRLRNNLKLGIGAGKIDEAPLHENDFIGLPAQVAVVPSPRQAAHYPGLQTALVVGVEGQVISATRDHEVKVQFHWQRGASPNRGGLTDTGNPDASQDGDAGNAPGNETSGTWIRVAQSIAGPNYGEVFLPRVGDEVLIDFEQGDPDRPIVIAALYNGEDAPPFAAGVDADLGHPGVISGLHATTLDGSGYNELVFDDAAGQPGMRAAASNLSSQLNLGHLLTTRPGMASRGSARGQGFEWVSDGWAVARADQGILLTTTLRAAAVGTVLDTSEAQGQIKAAQAMTQALSDAASHQGARALIAAPKAQDALLQSLAQNASLTSSGPRLQPDVPAFATSLLLMEGPSSIAFTTPATMLTYAGAHHQTVTQGDVLHSAGKTHSTLSGAATSLYTHTGGIAVIAANAPVSVQSHIDALEVLADQSVTLTSTDAGITVLADQKIVLLAGGASITLDGENITFAAPGNFSVKGADHGWGSGAKGVASLPVLPDGSSQAEPIWIELNYHYDDLSPVVGAPYKLVFEDGTIKEGTLDANGHARVEGVPNLAAKVYYGEDDRPYQPDVELPANTFKGGSGTNEEALANIEKYLTEADRYWAEQATAEQREYRSLLNAPAEPEGDNLWNYLDTDQQQALTRKLAGDRA